MSVARYRIGLDGSEGSVHVTMLLTSTEVETIETLIEAIDDERRKPHAERYSASITITKLDQQHQDIIEKLRSERQEVEWKSPDNPTYHAYCAAISALKKLDNPGGG